MQHLEGPLTLISLLDLYCTDEIIELICVFCSFFSQFGCHGLLFRWHLEVLLR